MRCKSQFLAASCGIIGGIIGALGLADTASAQVGGPGEPWRGAGPQACFGAIDAGANKCPAPGEMMAVKAGHLFDSKAGKMLDNQVILLNGERITEVGPAAQVKIPAGAAIIDLSQQ